MSDKLTPMMKQYLEIKKQHPNDILFFRMGDFYEMFFDDAATASAVLDIALTARQNDVPMCGIPYHAAESYLARLIKAGHRVAICEQMEAVPSSGTVVRREVVRVVTPGTLVESGLLQSDDSNFLASIVVGERQVGMAFIDISTGEFFLSAIDRSIELFRGEIVRFSPREAVFRDGSAPDDARFGDYLRSQDIPVNRINDWYYDADYLAGVIAEAYGIANLKGLGLGGDIEILAAGSIIQYLKDTQRKAFGHLKFPLRIVASNTMVLDDATIANLELVSNQNDRSRNRTLFSVLNHTRTPMGRRALERMILQPLVARDGIERRLDLVQHFFELYELNARLRDALAGVHDLERLIARITMGRSFPRDFLMLARSLEAAGAITHILREQPHALCAALGESIPDLAELARRISAAMDDEPALSPEHGRTIRPGFDQELDRLYKLKTDAKGWIMAYQEDEKKRLGIPTLRVKYNRILGYYIEISKGQTAKAPDDYLRKQTLVGGERYTTETLQKFETDILSASEKIVAIETAALDTLLRDVSAHRAPLQEAARVIAELDVLCSLASAAVQNRYVRPTFNDEGRTTIADGRHPIVERYYTKEVFIPNDIHLDGERNTILIITGPNMSGKSTYIRMSAIIQLMAQIGSFVPARAADLSIADRIFTRIGASDNIARGESTFLVEMTEAALILNNATDRSLIIMDEIGRGTSTFDGLAIAWATVEYLLRYLKAKTLFATHYHELTELGNKDGIANYTVLVKEGLHGVDFLHKVVPGAADKSYGIHVASLAGIPKEITARAAAILERLEKKSKKKTEVPEPAAAEQLEIFNAANHRVIQAIRNIDTDAITPLEALNELNRLKKLIE